MEKYPFPFPKNLYVKRITLIYYAVVLSRYNYIYVKDYSQPYSLVISVIKYLLWDLDVAILEHFRFSDIETSISIDIQQRGYKCFISMTDH